MKIFPFIKIGNFHVTLFKKQTNKHKPESYFSWIGQVYVERNLSFFQADLTFCTCFIYSDDKACSTTTIARAGETCRNKLNSKTVFWNRIVQRRRNMMSWNHGDCNRRHCSRWCRAFRWKEKEKSVILGRKQNQSPLSTDSYAQWWRHNKCEAAIRCPLVIIALCSGKHEK